VFDFRKMQGIFFSPDRLWGPNSLLFGGYWGALSPGVKRPEREADHLPPCIVEVNVSSYTSSPPRLHGMMLNYVSTGKTLIYFYLTGLN
jgi:hypothetical protein